jgi:EAL domain-containing protein (putative c-di-GMP-specific phosphodiesterase class I)/GGDEF domain-containing protein
MMTLFVEQRPAMGLGLYSLFARTVPLSYRNKIMLVAFLGTHIPLLTLVAWYALASASSLSEALWVIGVALVATLVGTGLTLMALNELLQPILMTAQGLRGYAVDHTVPALPTGFTDDAGTLMADTVETLRQLETTFKQLTHHDQLTGLPNREHLLEVLARRLARKERLALCVVMLRNFEDLSTGFGLAGADAGLRLLGERLVGAAGPGQMVARLEAGRFAFVLEGDETDMDLMLPVKIERVLDELRPRLSYGEMTLLPDLATGVALSPDDATDADALLNAALAAVPQDAQAVPGFFSPGAQQAARERLQIEHELRQALDNEELSLHFQPVVRAPQDAQPQRIVGAEALIRWNHPTRGLIVPGIFMPVAEQSELMNDIGRWVLRNGCHQLRLWDEAGMPSLRLAVNLSAAQFADPRLSRNIGDALDAHGVAWDRLEVEMTETAVMGNRDQAARVFHDLRALGVSVAIDDFGTGYSTMSQLKDLPFDTMKIDREFVNGVDTSRESQAICRALIELAKGLGITVLAEGVEVEADLKRMQMLGCDLFQGYYFSRPMPADKFTAWVQAKGGLATD